MNIRQKEVTEMKELLDEQKESIKKHEELDISNTHSALTHKYMHYFI